LRIRRWNVAVITISRGSYSHGKEVAERVCQKLGYTCIAREVLLEASSQFNIPEMKLMAAMQSGPSILDRFLYGKEKYVAYIQTAMLKHLQQDNVVYHGLAGHFFVRGIPHVLKVRVIADLEDRIKIVMERDQVSRKEALRSIKKIDEERRKWSTHLYGIDTWDASLYDLVLHIRKISVDDAVDIICHTVGLRHFQTTPESQRAMDDLVLAAEVKAALVNFVPEVQVAAQAGSVTVQFKAHESQELELVEDIERVVKPLPGVKDIKFHVQPITPFDL
jgi:cytidylate kinase